MKRILTLIALLLCASPMWSQVAMSSVTNTTRYNDQYAGANGQPDNGRATQGDTRNYAWLANGTVVGTVNDGYGGSNIGGGFGRNIQVETITAGGMDAVSLNSFDDFATSTCTYNGAAASNSCSNVTGSWTDGNTWKSTGIWARGSRLYYTVNRQLDVPPWSALSSSIMMSEDNGLTWCNYTHIVAQHCSGNASVSGETADVLTSGQAMWPTSQIRGPEEIFYSEGQSSTTNVDSNQTYAYLTAMSSDFTKYYLLRIPVGEVADLNVAEYQYSTGSNTWSSTETAAVPILNQTTGFSQSQVYYDSNLQLYVMPQGRGGIYFWSAPHPWGPWTATNMNVNFSPNANIYEQGLGFPSLLPETMTVLANGCSQYTLGADGDYSYQGSTPLLNNYSTQLMTVQLCSAASYTETVKATAHTNESVVLPGLFQEFNFAPTQTTSAYDSSGQGHNGTYSVSGGAAINDVAVQQGTAVNGSSSYVLSDAAGPSTTAQDFTATFVFRKQYAAVAYEKLFGNQTAYNVQGSFFCQRNGAAVNQFQCLVDEGGSGAITLSDDTWQEIVVVRSGTNVTLYDANSFNGTATATPISTFTSGTHALSGTPMTLGYSTCCFFNGALAYWNFYTRALSTTELTQNQSALVPRMTRKGIYLAVPILSNQKPLDWHTPVGAWSVARQLLSAYAGPAINVKRASDSTSTDIGFTSGVLNSSALTSFCTGTTCTINKIYDQSPNGFDEACTGGPIVYTTGAIVTSGGHPAAQFTNQYCVTPAKFYYFGIYASADMVASYSATDGAYGAVMSFSALGQAAYAANETAVIQQNNAAESIVSSRNGGPTTTALGITYSSPSVLYASFMTGSQQLVVDGSGVSGGGNGYRFIFNQIQFGSQGNPPGGGWTGLLSEAVVFNDALSGEGYANLRANQKAFYGTP